MEVPLMQSRAANGVLVMLLNAENSKVSEGVQEGSGIEINSVRFKGKRIALPPDVAMA